MRRQGPSASQSQRWTIGQAQANGSVARRQDLHDLSATLGNIHRAPISHRPQGSSRLVLTQNLPRGLRASASTPSLATAGAASLRERSLFSPKGSLARLGQAPGAAGGGRRRDKVAATFRQASAALVKPKADLEALEQELASSNLDECREILMGCRETLKDYGSRLEDRYRALDIAKSVTDSKSTSQLAKRHVEKAIMLRSYEIVRASIHEEGQQPAARECTYQDRKALCRPDHREVLRSFDS